MIDQHLLGLALIIILGGGAQWLAWRFHLPSILLLLVFGFLAGPVAGVLKPDALFGAALFPFISLAVAVILFEGGLGLRFEEIKGHGGSVRNLISIGVAVAWLMTSFAAVYVLGFGLPAALLLGAVLTVSGPTVVIPLLRHIRPSPHIGSILRWEGILVDSIGAVLAVLVFEFVVRAGSPLAAVAAIVKTAASGLLLGLAGALLVIVFLRRYWVPDFLHNVFALMSALGVFMISNALQQESGLVAVTVMGVALANQRTVVIKHIIEFKETLRVLLISSLFIVLAARIPASALADVDARFVAFLLALIFVVRPAAVAASTVGSQLTFREKAFLSSIYPRGIVAAAVAAVFAVRLKELGLPGSDRLESIALLTVVGTVAVYGFAALPFARLLGLAKPSPQGLLIAGAHPWARALAKAFTDEGYPVLLVGGDRREVAAARKEGLQSFYARSFSDYLSDEIELGDLGRLVAVTGNHELNFLVAMHFLDVFGRKEVYQLAVEGSGEAAGEATTHFCGRLLFGKGITHEEISRRFARGATVLVTALDEQAGYEAFLAKYGDAALPLCVLEETGGVSFFTTDSVPKPKAGQKIVSVLGGAETPLIAQ